MKRMVAMVARVKSMRRAMVSLEVGGVAMVESGGIGSGVKLVSLSICVNPFRSCISHEYSMMIIGAGWIVKKAELMTLRQVGGK